MDVANFGVSALSHTAQANVGLATLNLDFSLIKLEPPAEFKSLGNELNPTRKQAAEDGIPHVTARKLGALLQSCVPQTPHLIRAYGLRSVEIAKCRKVNPKGSSSDGPFAEHVGIEGTGIWAAATSGAHVIPVYLLACMIARMFNTAEATAVWDELVFVRKKDLAAVAEVDPAYEQSMLASRVSIPRQDLAQWDSSARSWLHAADEAKRFEQTQLMQVLNNVDLPVGTEPALAQNVLQAWKSAMNTVEALVRGGGQSVTNGAVLLGLSSWHIYPDMLVLGKTPAPVTVKMGDRLVEPGGLLTIGLQIQDSKHNGVYWSLPLAHLRYYGGPVLVEKSLVTQGNRLSVLGLFQVAVGCLIRKWPFDPMRIARSINLLWEYIQQISRPHTSAGTQYWIGYIARALEPMLVNKSENEKSQCTQLVRYGIRKCPEFLSPGRCAPALFGILQLEKVLQLMISDEAGVETIRQYLKTANGKGDRAYIIRYAVFSGNSLCVKVQHEVATAIPVPRPAQKRTHEGISSYSRGHIRWVATMMERHDGHLYELDNSRLKKFREKGEIAVPVESESIEVVDKKIVWRNPPAAFSAYADKDYDMEDFLYFYEIDEKETMDETYDDREARGLSSHVDFHHVCGDPNRIALYASRPRDKSEKNRRISLPENITLEELERVLKCGMVCKERLLKHLNTFICQESNDDLLCSLKALVTVEAIYKMLPGSLISLGVTHYPLCNMSWIPKRVAPGSEVTKFRFSPHRVDIGSTFACIALMESGSLAISPDSLQEVIAMATGDSIYMSAALLCDPADMSKPHEIRRVRGSIGKPGMAMLIPPKKPEVREVGKDWTLVNHADFDGRLDNSFQSTTLHLRFTDYILPIDVGSHGVRDFEIYFLESIVSAHDRGTWVADLDILGHLHSPLLRRTGASSCQHSDYQDANKSVVGNNSLTMIDSWDEILDPPNNAAIVRANNNPLGRLAIMALCLHRRHPTIVLGGRFCWHCVVEQWNGMQAFSSRRSPAKPPTLAGREPGTTVEDLPDPNMMSAGIDGIHEMTSGALSLVRGNNAVLGGDQDDDIFKVDWVSDQDNSVSTQIENASQMGGIATNDCEEVSDSSGFDGLMKNLMVIC